MNHLPRRQLLKGMLLSSTTLLGFDRLFGYNQLAVQNLEDDAQTILNLAATAETLACTLYYTVLSESNIPLTPAEVDLFKGVLDAEWQHLEYLNANGGQSLASSFYFPAEIYSDRDQFSALTELIESTFVAAYLAATHELAERGEALLATTMAQVAAIEQEHLAIARTIAGRRLNALGFARALFYNMSEVEPALQPFLTGIGNNWVSKSFPGPDAIQEQVGDAGVVAVATFINPATLPGYTAVSTCTITPEGNFKANLREGPSLGFPIVRQLSPEETLVVDGQSVDADGFTWLHAADGSGWARSDKVRFIGECGILPTIDT
ncbi:MAG: ferritin-like domain-containing protein [Anaerolineae bacterium]|nr:ferritin-like domain-containing protein [Anaerolineae bacterium]